MTSIGVDLVKIKRIKNLYYKFGQKFLDKCFTEGEIAYIKKKNYKDETIAGMFSFKESIAKCLGTGFGKDLKFKDIEICHDKNGAPYALAKGREFYISSSHDGDYVVTVGSEKPGRSKGNLDIPEDLFKLYKQRPDRSHKGSFGRTMVIGSSKSMLGAGYLSALASLKAGCGYTYHYVFKEDDILLPLSIKHTEVILRQGNILEESKKMDGILFGPGLGLSRNKREVLKELLLGDNKLVLDADGINMLAEDVDKLYVKNSQLILTPHILEFSRLIKEVIPPGPRLYERAKEFAKEYKLVLVLKDSVTLITDGESSHFIERENSGLATAGSGDVLAGIITSFLAQGYDPYEAALLGAEVHSLAGLGAAEEKSKTSMLAGDIINGLDRVFKNLEERWFYDNK